MSALGEALVSFAVLALVFVPLELAWQARTTKLLRPALITDGLFYLGHYVGFGPGTVLVLMFVHEHVAHLPLSSLRESFAAWPFAMRALVAVGLGDFLVYWGHRLQHALPFLWRFHRVHHTAAHLDWLAAHREHPLDGIHTRLLQNLPAMLLGFDYATVVGFVVFRGLWGLFIHSNVRVALGPLGLLVGAPKLHQWHHDVDQGQHVNFANLCPLWDVLFGTYYCPDHHPRTLGIKGVHGARYAELLLAPIGLWRSSRRAVLALAVLLLAFTACRVQPASGRAPTTNAPSAHRATLCWAARECEPALPPHGFQQAKR